MVGPVFYGWAFDTTESYDLALWASLAVMLIAVPATLALRKSPERVASAP